MSLYRRNKSPIWWVCLTVGGVKTRRSSGTDQKSLALEFERKLSTDLWRQHKLGERHRYTWGDAVKRWHREATGRGRDRDMDRLSWFSQYLADVALEDIDREMIEKLREVKCAETSRSNTNRTMALLRIVLRKAHLEWEWTERAAAVPMFPIERAEPRFLTRAQFDHLTTFLPPHLKTLTEFAVETGARMRNVTHLQWGQIDLQRKVMIVPASSAKAGRTLSLPLSERACEILLALEPRQSGPVFTYRGKEIDDANGAAFKAASTKAGVEWLRFHDLRHTWASWHIQAGTPIHVLQELGGWASFETVRRYAHLNPAHLARYADNAGTNRDTGAVAVPLSSA